MFSKVSKIVDSHLFEYFRGIQEILHTFEKAEKSREVSQEKIIKLKGKDSLICFIIKLRSPLTLIGMSQYAFFPNLVIKFEVNSLFHKSDLANQSSVIQLTK